ncbi:MAG: hypothetical protein ABIC95_05760 [archaeon]
MAKAEKQGLTDGERIEKNEMFVRVIVEMVGKPKDFIQETLKKYIVEVKKNDVFAVKKTVMAQPKKVDGGMFSTFVEIEMWVKTPNALIAFCFEYMPSSIEIMEPETIRYTASALASMLNDLQAKLFTLDAEVKTTKKENLILRSNLSNMLRNSVMLSISIGKKEEKDISTITGIDLKNLGEILETMVQEGHIKKEGDQYELAGTG